MPDEINVFNLLKNAESVFRHGNLHEPESDAAFLLSAVLKVKRSQLPLIREKKVSDGEVSLFNEYVQRRLKREPAAYITGFCGFMDFEFKVNNNVLIPRPETEILVENVLDFAKINKCESVLDLCTGSGCIAVSLAKMGDFKEITASDISFDSLFVAKENAALNFVNSIDFLLSDMFEALDNMKFDCIVSNPPYVSKKEYKNLEPELKFEPESALTAPDDGLFFYNVIASKASGYLNKKGFVIVELNANCADKIGGIFQKYGFKDIEIINDYAQLPRALKAHI